MVSKCVDREGYDNHCWVSINRVKWRIYGIRYPLLFLWRGCEPTIYTKIIYWRGK